MINKLKGKNAQEEMVGFALIIIMVGVILLVFLTISMKNTNDIEESYEIDGFLQAMLEYTTNCSMSTNVNYISIDRLILECAELSTCRNGISSCDVLNQTLNELIPTAWPIEGNSQFKAYQLIVLAGIQQEPMINISAGTITNSSKGASQPLNNAQVFLTIYY